MQLPDMDQSPNFYSPASLHDALATERRLFEPICEFERHDGYRVYRSDRFPSYYGANGIEIESAPPRRLRAWEDAFHEAFDSERFEHVTLTFAPRPELAGLIEEAHVAGYNVSNDVYLIATRRLPSGPPPDGLRLEEIDGEQGWERLGVFEDRLNRGYDWYAGEASSAGLLAKTRYVSERIGIRWIALTTHSGEVRAKLGVFRHGQVCRLQDVATLPEHRRRGLATYLLRSALDDTLDTPGLEGLVVCAERDYHAIDLYRKLGFRELGETVTLMRYPIRNAQGAPRT
jgi:ribosomal protein S18 acetylase RimI-like enzyme